MTKSTQDILAPISLAMNSVNQLILDELHSDIVLINQIGAHIVSGGGKRLRPAILLLSSSACEPSIFTSHSNNDNSQSLESQHAITLAAVIEFIHTATLLHDDVVDDSDMRRGKSTANDLFGNSASVLSGDFLYSRAFQMMVRTKNLAVMQLLSDTTNTIAEGEVMQLLNTHNPDLTESQYFETIYRKTAVLFAASCQLGALVSQKDTVIQQALFDYGHYMGMAFQIIDDLLDYQGDPEKTGKNIGNDLAEGKVTLPMIRAMQTVTATDKATLQRAIENGDESLLDSVNQIIHQSDALAYSQDIAKHYGDKAKKALDALDSNESTQAMIDLIDLAFARDH